MYFKKSFILLLFIFSGLGLKAQQFYRFKAEISVKDKLANGKYRLTMGSVYYDKIYKKIVYKLNFPEKENLVIQDTTIFKIDPATNTLKSKNMTILMPEFTVFHLALTGKLSEYGLSTTKDEPTVYKIKSSSKTNDGILTIWTPADDRMKVVLGDIKMLKKNKRLDAMIFYDKDGRMISRQFFKKYINVKGIEFPTEVTMISYAETGEQNIQQTTYKNIVIDQQNEDEIYRYKIPISKSATKSKK